MSFLEVDKARVDAFAMVLNFLESTNLVYGSTANQKSAQGIIKFGSITSWPMGVGRIVSFEFFQKFF